MALQKSHTDNRGNTYSQSYWRVVRCIIDMAASKAEIVIAGYKDKAARDANKFSVEERAYAVINDQSGSNFTDYFATAALNPVDKNPSKNSYEYLKAKVDFFSGATDV